MVLHSSIEVPTRVLSLDCVDPTGNQDLLLRGGVCGVRGRGPVPPDAETREGEGGRIPTLVVSPPVSLRHRLQGPLGLPSAGPGVRPPVLVGISKLRVRGLVPRSSGRLRQEVFGQDGGTQDMGST